MKLSKSLKILVFPISAAAMFLLTSCEKKGPAEKAGEKIDEAAEEVADEIDDATTN